MYGCLRIILPMCSLITQAITQTWLYQISFISKLNEFLLHSWTQVNTDDVLLQLEKTLFFYLADQCYRSGKSTNIIFSKYGLSVGLNISDLLPTIDELFSSPLLCEEGLTQSTTFVFCLKSGYEQLGHIID